MEQTFSGHGSVVDRNSIGNNAKIQGLFSRSTSQNFLRAMIILADSPLCSLKEFLDIVLGEEVPVATDEIGVGLHDC